MRLIDFFDRRAAMHPEHPFLIDDLGRTTYGESQATTHRIANVLIGLGCQPGTKVSVFSPNRARAFECLLGLARAGAAWVPLNANNGLQENCHILRGFDVEILLYHSSLKDRVASYLPHAPGVRHAVCIDDDEADGLPARMREVAASAPPDLARDPDSVTAVFPTGGTTGLSKGAIWTHRTWQTMIANLLTAFPVRRPPVNLVVAPMTHAAGGVAMMLMAAGATFVILPGFSPERVPAAIEQHRVTHLFLPPTAIYMLLAHPEVRNHDYSSLDYLIYAAAPMSVDKLRVAMEVFGPVMAQTFGQAEAPMLCTALTPREHAEALAEAPDRLASCGRATLLTEVAIMDDAGRLLPDGERGEIVVRGPLVMAGYYKNADATAEAARHGWHHTSDVGWRDSAGYHYIVDRKRDMIISGGFNIYPSEIEQVLWSHDDVQDCAVIGVPDDKWGEMVKAFVEPKPGRTLQPEALAAFCRERLGSVKVPKAFEVRHELPRSAVGKVLKRSLREEAWKNTGRAI
ncbi:class I adenylate-forming enzyme family protein [Pseudorhodoferax soli]|uniref:Acyl-CoA synthetase (AMP-forming)/AMP-acid ligase II n=1 Tax=Pseudorhodoferax soli TaxID=545864 RepID=A0A368XQU8_9BURK|nr:AMP-binding protein [Pseudorhodoferax soli]RCW69408.1 acyl-CoA synthetase (AMP-forming)/AMP-acid ligase II [Pseudorhodoferax soli]